MPSPTEPDLLVWDGNCGFCAWSLRVLHRMGATCEHRPWQESDLDALGLTEAEVRRAAWFVDGDGKHEGHAAIARALRTSRRAPARAAGRVIDSRPVSPLAGATYRWVARNRGRLPYPGRRG